jgi:hypothetical protein
MSNDTLQIVRRTGQREGQFTAIRGKHQEQAENFLSTFGFIYKTKLIEGRACPIGVAECRKGVHNHGLGFVFWVHRPKGPAWYVAADGTRVEKRKYGKEWNYWLPKGQQLPAPYDVVKSMAEALTWSVDPDEIYEELGGNIYPSDALARSRLAKNLMGYLTAEEVEALKKFN